MLKLIWRYKLLLVKNGDSLVEADILFSIANSAIASLYE